MLLLKKDLVEGHNWSDIFFHLIRQIIKLLFRFRTIFTILTTISNSQNNFEYLRSTTESFLFMFIYLHSAHFIYTRTKQN